MQKSKILTDNPQERLCTRLSWLGGMIDADGSITLYKRNYGANDFYVPRIFITNTNRLIIDEVCSTMKYAGWPYYVVIRHRGNRNQPEHHNNTADIIVAGLKRCNKILPDLIPFLKGKKDRAELMLAYIRSRLERGSKAPISIEELKLVDHARKLNARGKSSVHKIPRDYTPDSSYYEDEDIVRACAKS